jgi:hypothetical protein
MMGPSRFLGKGTCFKPLVLSLFRFIGPGEADSFGASRRPDRQALSRHVPLPVLMGPFRNRSDFGPGGSA